LNNFVNRTPFLRSSREFPLEAADFAQEVSKSYIDVASAVNSRIIGIFPANRPAITGSVWFVNPQLRQQTIRQVYAFSAAGNIPHGINTSDIGGFVAIYGTFMDTSGNWYPLPYVDAVNVNNQVSLKVTSMNIVIAAGGGSPPVISNGYVVLEWLATL
jgi:hypothetical protein